MSTQRADPGIGRQNAPLGSREWAERVRLHMTAIVNDVKTKPESLREYVDLVQSHRAWTLMNKPDGTFFASFEEFCAHRQPWGLGKPWAELRPFVEAVVGKRTVDLATVAPAKSPPGKASEDKDHDGPLPPRAAITEKRLRAIAERAPEAVRDLYRQGLVGVDVAAKLGPKNPTPEEAAKVTEIARAAADVAKAEKPVTEADKRRVQRKVNAVVREKLGTKPRSLVFGVEALWTAITALPESDQKTIRDRLVRTWGSVNT